MYNIQVELFYVYDPNLKSILTQRRENLISSSFLHKIAHRQFCRDPLVAQLSTPTLAPLILLSPLSSPPPHILLLASTPQDTSDIKRGPQRCGSFPGHCHHRIGKPLVDLGVLKFDP
jgi:hypothetical protein